ncbi:cobalamin-independent methionine synthase II family protein [Candidatus Pelagibacter sp.]|jgi:5-methyltetrahydropteroyltriglutamate--homocysteine methyltransferase|nr:cobalamin-independent methionine synthase II family protein [Candidatus Pelagibacter sp.]MDC0030438.1 cobalamin-independent methionine synthase II family protein [Candidatus Pelagibacter sp.]MDC0354461.1 cobalamin-independent methionine synthase II family protein [bacterium]MDC0481573.1 cobalamin-independent methionine synthase II family protein [Candidatus Pelagibacter sp.]MDC1126198.1 cobalamin-independent methionine synthase II family protein [Candidatus Pelagibacter sp.]
MDKIKTTHVGSLPRSNELSDLLFKKDKKEKIDTNNFDEIVKRDVKKIVEKQINLGIDFISDGEMSKISYATYVKDRIDGFSGESERKAPQDLDDFPTFKERIARSGGTPTYTRPCCTHELKIKDKQSLTKDINNFKTALEDNNHKLAFMNAASPGVISAFLPNKFYKDDDEYLDALSKIMTSEYEEIISNDINLQLDCPDLALARHMTFKDLSEEDFLKRAEKQIEFLNNSIKNIPQSKIRMHICWGNYEGPHSHDISLDKILPLVLKANVGTYLLESSNPRHSHEWQAFENIKVPKDKIIAPGVIDSTTNFIEHPEVVKNRLIQFSKVIDREQLMAGTDCGFSTFAGFGNVDENIVYKKLESLVIGADLASKII